MYVKKSKLSIFTVLLLLCALVMSGFPTVLLAEEAVSTVSESVNEVSSIRNIIVTVSKEEKSFHVTWTTDLEDTESVQWIEADKASDGEFPAECYSFDAVKEDGVARAKLTELESDTEYLYRVGNEAEGWSDVYSLNTGTYDDKSFSFLFISDPQVGDAPAEVDGLEWYRTINMAKQWFGGDAEFLMIGGDMVTNGRDEEEFLIFSKPDELRSFPLITTVGNHDEGEPYSRHFTYDDVDTSTSRDSGIYGGSYWVEYDGALIMSLNTNTENMALHRNFIENAIEEFTAQYGEPTWKLALFHQSIYSAAKDRHQGAEPSRLEYSSIFSEYGIDVALMGHDHVYTRSYMMDGDTPIDDPARYVADGDNLFAAYKDPAETEVLYVTANAAGDEHYDVSDKALPYAAVTNQENIPNVIKIDITPDSLSYAVHRTGADNAKDDIVDSFTILRTENGNGELRASEEVVNCDTEWNYLDDGSFPFEGAEDPTLWATDAFDDSSWKSGVGAFGALNGELAEHDGETPRTLLCQYFPEGSDDEGANIPNFFFRTTFDLSDPEGVEEIVAKLWYDDSANIFINGKQLRDLHLGGVGNMGYSGAEKEEHRTFGYFRISDKDLIDSLDLKESGNVLAVELYQSGASSEDIYFDFDSLTFIGGEIKLPFTDVKTTSWYYRNVARAYSAGLFAGVTETTFEPKSTMTRAMVWTVLAKMSDVDLSGGAKWYSKAQEWAMNNGVSDGTNPKNNITRQEIVTMLHSLSGKPAVEGNLDSFTDKGSVSSWAVDALVWAVENGIMTGRGAGILDPRTDLTRAEACTVILSYIDIQ